MGSVKRMFNKKDVFLKNSLITRKLSKNTAVWKEISLKSGFDENEDVWKECGLKIVPNQKYAWSKGSRLKLMSPKTFVR